MKSKILGLLAVGLSAGPMPANAVTLSAGQSVTCNFDLPGATPSGPYSAVSVIPLIEDVRAGDIVTVSFFPQLGGAGDLAVEVLEGGVFSAGWQGLEIFSASASPVLA